jgi:O-antigen biosynthesis protein
MGLLKSVKYYLKKSRQIKNLQTKKVISTFSELDNNLQKELVFNTSLTPIVSIIIPFYNKLNYTYNCLNYLHKNVGSQYKYEIILIDDNSTSNIDLSIYKGIRKIKNKENVGFTKSINIGIRESVGEYIYILNNDSEVQKGFLDELFFVFNNFTNVGAVVSKLINANGSLQQAGTVFFKEYNQIVTKKEIFYPEVNYIKRVDCCSGYNLLFKKYDDNGNVNLFDEQFAPAHFEETDFCFQLKYFQNKNIYYTPFSEVVHLGRLTNSNEEYNTLSPDNKKENLINANLHTFKNKWQTQLNAIQATSIETRVEELYDNKSIVFFVGIIPPYDKDSGSNRLKEIIHAYIGLGYHVSILKKKTFLDESNYFTYYQKMGVCVFYEHNKKITLEQFLTKNYSNANITWFYNPVSFEIYYDLAKQILHKAKFVFDMVDIHHLRYERALKLDPKNKIFKKNYNKFLHIEKKAAKIADYVITISDFDKKYMSQFCNAKKIVTISNIHYTRTTIENTLPFEDRKDILFIGSIHEPNIDALYFLYNDIMPIVWEKIPHLKVNIIGNIKEKISDINNPNFTFTGYLPNIEELFLSSKFMVAPLRYGAGVKGKIGQAFEYFLPVITTTIGAEGIELIPGETVLINDDAEGFANSIISLYSNKLLWLKLQSSSEKNLIPFSKNKLEEQLSKINQTRENTTVI